MGCASGIYLAHYGTERAPLYFIQRQYASLHLSRIVEFRKVLNDINPASISALQTLGDKTFNKLVVHADASVFSYSLETIVRVGLGHAHPQTLEVVAERIGGNDNNILFCKHLQIGPRFLRRFSFLPTPTSALTLVLDRFLVVYASKKRLSTTLNLHVLEAIDTSKVMPSPTRTAATSIVSYRPYGDVSNISPTSSKRMPYVYLARICTKGCVRHCRACEDDWDLHSRWNRNR